MAGKLPTGLKKLGCQDPTCESCARVTARSRAFGPSNVYVAITPAEYCTIQRTPGLEKLAQRIHDAVHGCTKRRPQ